MALGVGHVVEFQGKDGESGIGLVLTLPGKGVRLLLPNRKETTIAERNILHATKGVRSGTTDLDAAVETLQVLVAKRKALAVGIDLAEVHGLLVEDPRGYSTIELAGFFADGPDEDFQAALLRRLLSDTLYFKQKKEGFVPQPQAEVELARAREEKRRAQEREETSLLEEIRQAASSSPPIVGERLKGVLESLVQVATLEQEAPVPKRLFEILEKADLSSPRKLSTFLTRIGRFSPDENLLLLRYRVPVGFSDAARAEAVALCARQADATGREDLRPLRTWALDSEGTRDRDDAFSILPGPDGQVTLWVHIADGAHWITPGSTLDQEVSRRGTSIYMPDRVIPMLPPELSEGHLSLSEGADRLTLSMRLCFAPDGSLADWGWASAVIRVTEATDYWSADARLGSEPDLVAAVALADRLRTRRGAAGAVLVERPPELKLVITDGRVEAKFRPARSPCQETVAEFMIWANHVAGAWCRDQDIPCLYRVQDAPEHAVIVPPEFEPLVFFTALRQFKKTVISPRPGRHSSLGVDPYCQVTSPLRRYSDLLLHRQIKGRLAEIGPGGEPCGQPLYGAGELSECLLYADEAVRVADEVMIDRYRYFLLEWLQQEQREGRDSSPAVVVDNGLNDVTAYLERIGEFRHCRKPTFDYKLGDRLTARWRQIDPFERVLRFELLAGTGT